MAQFVYGLLLVLSHDSVRITSSWHHAWSVELLPFALDIMFKLLWLEINLSTVIIWQPCFFLSDQVLEMWVVPEVPFTSLKDDYIVRYLTKQRVWLEPLCNFFFKLKCMVTLTTNGLHQSSVMKIALGFCNIWIFRSFQWR